MEDPMRETGYVCTSLPRGMKGFFLYILLVLAILSIQFIAPGCANIVPPEGGPRDTTAPALVEARPGDSTLNFSGNRISFTFDEFVKLDNAFQNVTVSPIPRNNPNVTSRLNTVTVRLRDSLEANTTYTINFGNAIVDVNESNPFRDFTYVFSTGPSLDSLTFGGKVIMAETGEVDSTLIVMLHRTPDDSALVKERPRYMTKLNAEGRFQFKNLPSDTFYVYALKDESRSFRYLNKNVAFAFADSPVIVSQNTPPVTLYAYHEVKTSPSGTTTTAPAGERRLKYQASANPDNTHDLLKPFRFTFERPLRNFDTARIQLASDSSYTPIDSITWSLDSTRKIATMGFTWQPGTLYHLIIQKDFATDTLGQQLLKADTISFTTRTPADYGLLSLRFRNLDLSVNPVLQFVQGDQLIASYPLTISTFSRDLFPPGEYKLRILLDENGNGTWDPGEFFRTRRQPELVKPIQRTINVRKNVKNEVEVQLD